MKGALYAAVSGYFWLPCPNCGEMFGGWECGKGWHAGSGKARDIKDVVQEMRQIRGGNHD